MPQRFRSFLPEGHQGLGSFRSQTSVHNHRLHPCSVSFACAATVPVHLPSSLLNPKPSLILWLFFVRSACLCDDKHEHTSDGLAPVVLSPGVSRPAFQGCGQGLLGKSTGWNSIGICRDYV